MGLQAQIEDGLKRQERKQMRLLTLKYMQNSPPPPPLCFFLLDFLPLSYKLDCFDKFPKAEVKWSFVLKWVTWRVNAQRSKAFHFPMWKESPELSCPLRARQKKKKKRGIDYPWRVEKRDSQCPRSPERNLKGWVWKHWQNPLAPRAPACQTRGELNWKDHPKSLKCLFFSARITAKPLHWTWPRSREG